MVKAIITVVLRDKVGLKFTTIGSLIELTGSASHAAHGRMIDGVYDDRILGRFSDFDSADDYCEDMYERACDSIPEIYG